MRILTILLLMDRQIRGLFHGDGGQLRFFPGGVALPGLAVTRRQRRRIERRMPAVYARLVAVAAAGNLAAAGGITLWDRFVGYVDALLAVAVFALVLALLAAVLHGWLYMSVRHVIRDAAS